MLHVQVPYVISAAETCNPSFGVVRGRCEIQSGPVRRAMRASLRLRWLRSNLTHVQTSLLTLC